MKYVEDKKSAKEIHTHFLLGIELGREIINIIPPLNRIRDSSISNSFRKKNLAQLIPEEFAMDTSSSFYKRGLYGRKMVYLGTYPINSKFENKMKYLSYFGVSFPMADYKISIDSLECPSEWMYTSDLKKNIGDKKSKRKISHLLEGIKKN